MPSIINRDVERLSYQVYVTDVLQLIAESTAATAACLSGGKADVKVMTRRWADKGKPAPKEETRTAEEIIESITEKLKGVGQDRRF